MPCSNTQTFNPTARFLVTLDDFSFNHDLQQQATQSTVSSNQCVNYRYNWSNRETPWWVVRTLAFVAGGLRFKSQQGRRLYLFTYLFIYLLSFIQFSFLYRLIMITNNEITCGRGACTCTKDDAEEWIIVLKFESFRSRQ